MTRASRRARRQTDQAIREVTEFIDDNPLVSAISALAAGAIATGVFKMFVNQPAGVSAPSAPKAAKKKAAVKKKTAKKKKAATKKKTTSKKKTASKKKSAARK